jgi:hypothetical protein
MMDGRPAPAHRAPSVFGGDLRRAPTAIGSLRRPSLGDEVDVPRLACWSCGRVIYATAPIEALFVEERRCPRCGAMMNSERREEERRQSIRRQGSPSSPGPPDGVERRLEERRRGQRRGAAGGLGRRRDGARRAD